jgi:glycosyltransferase involved in cell wall biosynthesis
MGKEPIYVIVSPVRDEANYIDNTINSVLSQTVRPFEWIIVDDGSSDGTGPILDRYAELFSWIKVVRRENRGFRRTGGRVIEAFNRGFEALSDTKWDFIVKLDCDLSFEPNYFEALLSKFNDGERLGIASGVYLEKDNADLWKRVSMPSYHAAGACKVVRNKCFKEIEGFIASAGWDTVDEIKAMSRGWKTGHFVDLEMKHHKREGSGIGMIRTSVMHGEISYLIRSSKFFFLIKVIHRIGTKPFVLGAVALLWGYFNAMWERKLPLVNPSEARCYNSLLLGRLMGQRK